MIDLGHGVGFMISSCSSSCCFIMVLVVGMGAGYVFIIVMAMADSYFCIIITFVIVSVWYMYIHYATNFSITHPSFASFLWMTFLAGSGHRAPPASPTSDGITQHDRR